MSEQVEGEIVMTFQHPSGPGKAPLPREIRIGEPGIKEGTYKLVRVEG